jgi:hypothetical protein
MATLLVITYQKKLGLPNYSSHSCSVSLTVEIPDMSFVADETKRLYELLQASVDEQIQEVGFMPDASRYGMNNPQNGNGYQPNGNSYSRPQNNGNRKGPQSNGNGHSGSQNGNTQYRQPTGNGNGHGDPDVWNCTDGQKGMIKRLVNENNIPKDDVEGIAKQFFGVGVKQLDKLQASQVIEELLERCGKKPQRGRWQQRQAARS